MKDSVKITQDLINVVSATFVKKTSTVKTKPCRVKFEGQFITTESGKTVWRNIGFAKSAMLNHLNSQLAISVYLQKILGTPYVYGKIVKEMLRELERAGVVEYVEVNDESLT